nr:protease inhibitor I9 family protein [Chloroflexota bacterium]
MARMSLSSRVAMLCAAVCLLIPLGPVAATGTVADGARSGSYIVVLRPGATARTAVAHAADAARRYGLRVNAVYRHALQGYAATIPDEALAALRADPSVAYVEPDRAVTKRNEPPATRSGALTDSALKGDTPRSCLRANDADPNRARLQLCIKGLSMLSIRGIQPGSGPPPDPRTRESLDRRATGLPCTAAPGDDRCEAWAARFDHAHLNVFESPLGMAVSPIGDRVFVAGLDWDLKRGEQTMAIVAYEGRTGRREWTSLPYSGDGGGCAGCAVTGIAASPDGTRVYVTGFTQNSGTSADIRTLALDAASGAVVWDDRYNSHADPYKAVDTGVAIAVSPNGRWVYATGTITDLSGPVTKFRNVLIGYDPRSGRRQWISRSVLYDSYNQIRATGDRVYATGSGLNAGGSHFGAVTVAIDGRTGAPSWRRMYNGGAGAVGDDNGLDLVVSQDGSRVYMTGYTTTGPNGQLSWLTAAYAAGSGRSVWTRRHADQPGQNVAHAIAVSPSGDRVYAVGYTTGRDDRFKPATAAYDGATGAPAWTQRY